jgi:hypothetical protein
MTMMMTPRGDILLDSSVSRFLRIQLQHAAATCHIMQLYSRDSEAETQRQRLLYDCNIVTMIVQRNMLTDIQRPIMQHHTSWYDSVTSLPLD